MQKKAFAQRKSNNMSDASRLCGRGEGGIRLDENCDETDMRMVVSDYI
jgi:hypothetical protein